MKKNLFGLSIAACVLSAALVGGTMAYFSHTTAPVTNTFTSGSVAIALDEAKVTPIAGDNGAVTWTADKTASRVTANSYENIYPGAILPKDPTVHNTGKNAAYVRVHVTIQESAWTAWKEALTAAGLTTDGTVDLTTLFKGFDAAKWTPEGAPVTAADAHGVNVVTYTYRYNTVLAAGASTAALFTELDIPTVLTLVPDFELKLTADAIQASSFDSAAAAWNQF